MLLLSVLLVVNYQQQQHHKYLNVVVVGVVGRKLPTTLKVLCMQSPFNHRTLEMLYPYTWLARCAEKCGFYWETCGACCPLTNKSKTNQRFVVIVFNRGQHTLCNDTSWKTVRWIWAEIQLVVNCNLGSKNVGKALYVSLSWVSGKIQYEMPLG